MKILAIGLSSETKAALKADTHLVIPCQVSDTDDLFEYVDCETPEVVAVDVDAHPWVLTDIPHLRMRKVTVPVVGLVSPNCMSRGERRANFLESGGNDLFEKPVHLRELAAALDSLSRLYSGSFLGRTIQVSVGSAVFFADTAKHYISIDNQKLSLTPMEYKILLMLMLHKGEVVSRKSIQGSLYGFLDAPEYNTIEVLMTKIRKKVAAVSADAREAIQTIRQTGYRLDENVV